MRKTIVIIICLIAITKLYAQINPEKAPLNPEFVEYLETSNSSKLKAETPEGYQPGYIPSPLNLYFKELTDQFVLKSFNALPTQYDLRTLGFVSPVKNQGGGSYGGNAVAFATMGSIESRLLVLGRGLYDLSEQNIAACYGYLWGYGEGANHEMATAYLSRFSGPVLESEDPYNTMVQTCLSGLEPAFLVPESRWLPNDKNLIKQTILDFGGLYCSVHIEYANFNEPFKTYYYDGTESGNHAWMVVGWDDLKLVPGAGEVGAWIIKNSWGDAWMDTGFVYCSYADTRIMDNVAHWPEIWDKDVFDTLYMYDYLGAVLSIGYNDYTAYGVAKYVAPEEQFITKVGTFVNAEGSVLDISIYDDFDGKDLTNLLNSKSNIYVDLPGYYTFDLPATVNGDFYIKIRYYTPGYIYPIPVETFVQDYANPVIETGVNWISPDNKTWNSCDPDAGYDGENLTIRAYALKLTSPVAIFESNKEKVCLGSNITYSFLENDSVNEYHWNFGTDASPATADKKGPHQVSYSSEGRKTISLIVAGPNGSDTLVRHDYILVVPEIEVIIPEREASSPVEQPYVITAFGADTYEWSPSDYLDKTTGQTVTATPLIPGDYTYVVTGYQGICSSTDTFTLSAQIRPHNDNVCNAIELIPSEEYMIYSNRNATIENNEPAPPEGDCNAPLQWCIEGGLQNSVWFWFVGPKTGIVSFDTKGMDTQIAIYRADSCTDILNNNFTLIAANDDYYSGELSYAAALESVTVTSGQRYFVQIDGSSGGVEGSFLMSYRDHPLIDNRLYFTKHNISCYGANDGSIELTVEFGTPPYKYLWSTGDTTQDVNNLPPGKFLVSVTDAINSTVIDSIIISQPDLLIAEIIDSTNISYYGFSDGTAIARASGGISPYQFIWDDSEKTADYDVRNLKANVLYYVIVKDANGCIATDSVILAESNILYTEIGEKKDVTCYGYTDGYAVVTSLYGEPPLAYQWDDPSNTTDSIVTSLQANIFYHVFVIDALGNVGYDSVMLSEPPTPDFGVVFITDNQLLTSPPFAFQFNNNTPDLLDYYFTWDFGDSVITQNNNPTVFHEYQYNGTYDIKLTAEHRETGCLDSLYLEDYVYCTGGNNPAGLEPIWEDTLKIYPNPFNYKVTIVFNNPSNQAFQFFLTDLAGKIIVIQNNITGDRVNLDRQSLSKGLYLIEIRGTRIYRGKIIVE